MSDHIPFEIQSEIMKMLPVKSLLQFRSVSKQWKSLIDSSEFIKNYHLNHTNPKHHLLVRYKLNTVQTYTSITDDNTFPQQKFPLTTPESLSLLRHALTLGSVKGLLCYFGCYKDTEMAQKRKTEMAVIWNPTVRKSVGIVIPNELYMRYVVGFGVCPRTSDPKLVKISVDKKRSMWVVEVFTLSRRVWETVYTGAPFKSYDLVWHQVSVDGVIYWRAYDDLDLDDGFRSNFIISFDLKSDKFGEVRLPDRLVYTHPLSMVNVNESLVLLECNDEGETAVCGVWMRKDGENKPFTKIYTVKVEGRSLYNSVLGFRKNGEVVLELEDDNCEESEIEVYEPSSGRTNSVGIKGQYATFSARSYIETLLLLDQSNTIIGL
ncbi:F-box domain-containing protein [Artemisia annua]|uniref:F-box domain-containing protein n=1 Tax=Artemisia annua TaxID=35608 RepID=A0A2U1NG50_ARTAN|nr:F-box domain-containing protein [Artemisia annua]